MDRYRVIGAANIDDQGVLDGPEFFEQLDNDSDEPDPAGTFTLHARAGSDGIGISGSLDELWEWTDQIRREIAAAGRIKR